MVLSTVRVEDFERFWNTFSTKGAEKRKQHGSKGSQVFLINDDNRVWVLFGPRTGRATRTCCPTRRCPRSSRRRGSKAGPRRRARASARRLAQALRAAAALAKEASAVRAARRLSWTTRRPTRTAAPHGILDLLRRKRTAGSRQRLRKRVD